LKEFFFLEKSSSLFKRPKIIRASRKEKRAKD